MWRTSRRRWSRARSGARYRPCAGYQTTLRLFCDYLTDRRYEWVDECQRRFDSVPSQVCHEWNTVAHLSEYEGRPERRPLTYDELQALFDHADARVDRIAAAGRKGALARCALPSCSRPRTRSGYAATSWSAWTWLTCDPTLT
jgi:hypothetical protein